jgi:long-subunit fatty acid transport protein
MALNMSLAWQASDKLSVAAGINYIYAKSKMSSMLDQTLFAAPDGEMRMNATGDSWGYNLGLLYRMTIGVTYRGAVKITSSGDVSLYGIAPDLQSAFGGATYTTGVTTSATFPDVIGIGVAFRPDDRLTFAFDAELVQFRSLKRAVCQAGASGRFCEHLGTAGLARWMAAHGWR